MTSSLSKESGGDPEDPLEGAGEVVGITEAEFLGNLLHKAVGVLKQIHGPVHAEMLEVLGRALAAESLENPAQIGEVQVAGIGHALEGIHREVILLDKPSASLVSSQAGAFHDAMGDGEDPHFHHKILEGNRAEMRPVGMIAEPEVDEIIEDLLDLLGMGDLRHASRQKLVLL